MANRIVGTLEQMEFADIDQLNEAVRRLIDIYNDRSVPFFGGRSRREVYLSEKLHCMQGLPAGAFSPSFLTCCSYVAKALDMLFLS